MLIKSILWYQLKTKIKLKMTAFSDIVPCSLEADRRFRGVYRLHHQGDEMSVYFNETTQRYMPKAVIFTLAVMRI
jgi:hypothetical protein